MDMMRTDEFSVMPIHLAEYESGRFLGETVDAVDQLSILGNGLSETSVRPAECVSSLGTCVVCHTRLREELAALRDREKGKAEYTRMLVHELRAPVTASRSLAAALRYVHPEGTQVNQVLGRIEKRMDQLLDLVNDILHLNGIKAGQPLGETVDCDLVAETRSICEPYLEEATAKGLSMEISLPASPTTVHIARQDYQLILSNLVSNAVKYTPAGTVAIALRQEGPWAVLDIRDSGIGIPVAEVTQIFTEFFRASNARRSQVPGTGLGLAGVKALVERSGGELAFESQENQGSRFTVRLPLHRSPSVLPLALPKTKSRVRHEAAFSAQPPDAWAA
jgi:signal transduction histidine kinase